MQKTEAAMILAGVQSEENREASAPTNLHVITGTVVETSESGKAKVSLDGLIFSADNEQSIEIDTLGGLEEGDTATILLSGESGHGMLPMAIGAGGSVDRVVERVKAIEADYVKATLLDAQVAQIGFLKADSAAITNLQTQTAKIENLTAEQLSAAAAYIAALTAGNITATSLTADVAKIHNLTAEQLSAAAGYISQLTADSVTAQNISAMYGDFATVKANAAKVANLTAQELEADHATIADLDSTYAQIGLANVNTAQITNGIIQTASIVDEQVFTVSGNKATLAEIDASKINVSNLNADNITVNKINGQTVTGKSISDALTQHETDISAKVDTTTFNNTVNSLNDRIDGAIETFTGTVVPTLNNTPASAWNTNAKKDQHVGDVYYVVNANSDQNGYCYRFTKSGSTYSWQLIKDSDVTAALSRLQTAEGKITTFDSDISTLKTDTGQLKTQTQNLETSLGDKVDVTTFNDLSSDVEENSASITTLSNTVSQKADSSTVTTLSNTVNQVKQTADTNKTSITNLTQTVNQKADSSTVTTLTQRTSTIEQNLSGITTRVGTLESTSTSYGTRITNAESTITQHTTDISLRATKTEAYQVAQPNLTPYFLMPMTQTTDTYWDNISYKRFTQLEDGWAHFEHANSGSSTVNNYILPKVITTLTPGGRYTLLVEFRNVSISANGGSFYSQQNTYAQVWGADSYGGFSISNADIRALANGAGVFRKSLTLLTADSKDPSGTVRGSLPKTQFMSINQQVMAGQSVSYDLRLSLYEGEYAGPYKPYVGGNLYASQAELKVANDAINLRVEKSGVIGAINLSSESATIAASKVNIEGAAIFTSGGRLSETSLNNAYDAKGAAATVQDTIVSRGEQLVINGNGFMGDNTNFSSWSFDGAVTNNSAGSFTRSTIQSSTLFTDGMFPVDPSKEYIAEFDVKAESGGAKMYAMLAYFDVDKLPMGIQSVSYVDGSTTTLARELKNGDTKVYLTSVAGFAKSVTANHQRALIFWNYTNSYGYTYPPETYSRNYYINLWTDSSSFDTTNNTITLNAAWSYGTFPAGTSVSQNTSGNGYAYFWYVTNKTLFPTAWTHISGTYGGVKSSGNPNAGNVFWPGTAYCKIAWLWNYEASSSDVQSQIWITNVSVKENRLMATQRVYYRTSTAASVAAPTTWVTANGNVWSQWTTKVPRLTQNADGSGTKYPYLYTCEQHRMGDGSIVCTAVLLDENTTVIDGGNIITNTVTGEQIAANTITADNMAANSITLGKMPTADKSTILNSNIHVGGKNLLGGTHNPDQPLVGSAVADSTFGDIGRYNSPDSEFSAENYDGSSRSLIITSTATGNRGVGWFTKAGVIDKSETYTFSCKIKSSVAATFHMHTAWRNGSATAGYTGWTSSNNLSVAANTWTDYVYSFTPNSNAQVDWEFYVAICFTGKTSGVTARIAHAKLEKGNVKTDWSPAPEDQTNYVDILAESIDEALNGDEGLNQRLHSAEGVIESQGKTLSGTTDKANATAQALKGFTDSVSQWLTFNGSEGMTIGDTSNNYQRLDSTSQRFYSDGIEVMRTEGGKVEASSMDADEVHVGEFMWVARSNGHTAFKWAKRN